MIIVKIMLVIVLFAFWMLTIWISYLAGIMKGFKNFIVQNADEWNVIDKVLYQQFTHRNMDDINPAAQYIAEGRIKEFNDKKHREVVKSVRNEIIKETAKEIKKVKRKNKKGGKK
jgi:lipopolysaccharide export LptBFGC system permease protein LptF